jgi:hypothetical protein
MQNTQNNKMETYQITRFVDDVSPTMYNKPGVAKHSEWMTDAEENRTHNITDILQRPVEVFTGTFSASFSGVTINFPNALIDASSNLKDKLNHFEFLRADIHVKLVFNATPFQQGKYWLFFAPYDAVSGRGQTGQLQNQTGYPGIEIDLATGAPVELVIPYCSPLSHYRLTNGDGTMGDLILAPINNLSSGITMDNSHFTIFAWFENIDLMLPTQIVAQMDEEERMNKVGLIRPVLDTVAGAAEAVSSIAPPLSVITRPLGWITRALSGTLAAFGFNKPLSEAANSPYTNIPAKGYTHMDGLDMSTRLAAAPDCAITTESGIFSSSIDEMDLDYVKSKSCICKNDILWDVTQAPDTKLFTWTNSPASYTNLTGVLNPTTVNFLASMFQYWRGGMKYRLSVTKTAFHTGRLRISFVPAGAGGTPTTVNSEFNHNWILDLSKSSEIEFTLPYISNVPWLSTAFITTDGTVLSRTGVINVEILTPLRAASTNVAQSVNLVLWHSGASDLEFAVPEFSRAFVLNTVALEAQIFNEADAAISHNEQLSNTSVPMFGSAPSSYVGPEKLSIGEKITSLRQLIKRFGEVSRGFPFPYRAAGFVASVGPLDPALPANEVYGLNNIQIDPAYFGDRNTADIVNTFSLPSDFDAAGAPLAPVAFPVSTTLATNSPINYISYLFRFWRGAKRYKVFLPSSGSVESFAQRIGDNPSGGIRTNSVRTSLPVIVKRASEPKISGFLEPPFLTANHAVESIPTFEHTIFPDITGCVEFEAPYYSTLPISLVSEGLPVTAFGPTVNRSLINVTIGASSHSVDVPAYQYIASDTVPNSPFVFRPSIGDYRLFSAAGDDFSFGYLVGAPQIVRRT